MYCCSQDSQQQFVLLYAAEKETVMEIERKFLVRELPGPLSQYDHAALEQGYLCTGPVVRVRREGEQ